VGARIGMLVRNSGRLEADRNRIIAAKVFGITARGPTSHVTGQYNVITGSGFRAVDASVGAALPVLPHTQDAGWVHHLKINFWAYLRFHPLALLWLSILLLVIFGELWSRIRRLPEHAYAESTHWRPAPTHLPYAPAGQDAAPVLAEAMAGGRGFPPGQASARSPNGAHTAGPPEVMRPANGHRHADGAKLADVRRLPEVITLSNGHWHADAAKLADDHRPAGAWRWPGGNGQAGGHPPADEATPNGQHRPANPRLMAETGTPSRPT
jgi:hypothetical protein